MPSSSRADQARALTAQSSPLGPPSTAGRAEDASVIRHKPAGRGHAYRASLDQRVPQHPLAGGPVRLGALASPGLAGVQVEVRVGGDSSVYPLQRLETAGASSGADGHLAAAAEAG